VSEALARKLFGKGEAVGRHVRVGTDPGQQDLEIVGVVGNTRLYDVKSANLYAAYVPALQDPDVNYKCFVLRGRGISARAVEHVVDSLGQEQVTEVQSLDEIIGRELLQERMTADFAAFFGGLALLLAAVGLYGLMSYAVAQRRREIGVRVALGAQPRRVMGEVVRDGLRVALVGIACGVGAALVTVSLVKSLLFGLTPHDPATLVIACFSLLAVALVACLGPALRAARVDPMTALRTE
jgi:predicted lysophospholipase L1 biosynthesis ABC-type transport system permease subunit